MPSPVPSINLVHNDFSLIQLIFSSYPTTVIVGKRSAFFKIRSKAFDDQWSAAGIPVIG